ncbi:pickpocket protein 28-like [Diorhabda sublineata]|uniref:pickpocket protein 28-like n=1 Tax=Diorhabda sublineata TaxID=1163346 RepID=UPI0024E1601D|nr:pickpocket protein 28-like [Diorhabda sublineata]XP_056638390.1 pickpocket protein 28-like [Diorhabda sublineata]
MSSVDPPINGSDIENAKVLKEIEVEKEKKKYKRKYPGFRKNLYDYFQEFTDNTGIHGFKYMGEQKRTMCERFWWVILFCISLFVCTNLIIKTWIKWDQSPVLVSFARSPTPVWQIPFPAISICSETKTKQTVYNFTNAYDRYIHNRTNMTDEEMKHFSDSSLICDNHLYTEGDKYANIKTIDYLMSVAPQFEEIFFTCSWTLLNETCYNLFTPIITEEGLCFTFNMLDRSELFRENVYLHSDYMQHGKDSEGWTLEKGYPKSAKIETFPRRALSAGFSASLILVLKGHLPDLDYICKGAVQGFKILFHHPAEPPNTKQYFRAPLNQEIVVSVKPDMMTTSEGLRNYDPHRRQCYFPTEKYLSYFKSYTQHNCQVECLTNHTLAKCGCVAYHMPHTNDTRICGPGSQTCMFNVQTELLTKEVTSGILNYEAEDRDGIDDCDCLPACTSLTYNAEMSQAKYEWDKVFQSFRVNFSEFDGIEFTRLTIFFKDQQFITSERNELYGQTDFLANCGGILGLFTGFSFLSIVEIAYFLSLRMMCNIKHYGKHYWSGSPALVNDAGYVH